MHIFLFVSCTVPIFYLCMGCTFSLSVTWVILMFLSPKTENIYSKQWKLCHLTSVPCDHIQSSWVNVGMSPLPTNYSCANVILKNILHWRIRTVLVAIQYHQSKPGFLIFLFISGFHSAEVSLCENRDNYSLYWLTVQKGLFCLMRQLSF